MPSGCVYEQSFIGTLLCPIHLGLSVVAVTQYDPQRLQYLLTDPLQKMSVYPHS